MNIHIHIENDDTVSSHTWKPNVDINQLIDWWHSIDNEDSKAIIREVKTLGRIVKCLDDDPDPRWCLFLSNDGIYFTLGDKYFKKEVIYGIV